MNLIIFGPPGSGKGTQAHILKRNYNIHPLSTGDILRQALEDKTDLGLTAKSFMDKGQLVPDDVVIEIISEALDQPSYKDGFILDGFPRNQSQARALDKMLNEKKRKIDIVLVLKIDDSMLGTRIGGRFSCGKCGSSYHKDAYPTAVEGICDECGSTDFIARGDDDIETLKKRLKIFHEETEPILTFYAENNMLHYLDADTSVEVISAQIAEILKQLKS